MTNMKFCSIASGSSGNCYFLEVAGKKYLVDAGISFKRIREALASLSVDIGDISGVFITHEHSDHLSGLPMLIKKTGMEIFSSPGTLMEISRKYEEIPFSRLHDLRKCSTNLLDGVRVRPFPVFHDAKDPVASLDAAILQDHLLAPVLGIADPRTDDRIKFIGGIRGMAELEKLVNQDGFAVAFSLYPTTMEQIMKVADAGAIMPPKSTWFEPKLRSGLFVHAL